MLTALAELEESAVPLEFPFGANHYARVGKRPSASVAVEPQRI